MQILSLLTVNSAFAFGLPTKSPPLITSVCSRSRNIVQDFPKKQFIVGYFAAVEGMPRGVKKENLPFKICVTCNRPFNWRKKWEKCWDEVTTCSNSCNRQRRLLKQATSDTRATTTSLHDESGSDVDEEEVSTPQPETVVQEVENNEVDDNVTVANTTQQSKKTKSKDNKNNGSKLCDKCGLYVDQLIRCRIDASRSWHMICNDCWPKVSGGVTDGDDAHPFYQYGGLWKNRRKV